MMELDPLLENCRTYRLGCAGDAIDATEAFRVPIMAVDIDWMATVPLPAGVTVGASTDITEWTAERMGFRTAGEHRTLRPDQRARGH